MSEPTAPPATPDDGGRLGILAAVLLGIAATLTAISAYNAALKDGEALEGYSTSNAALAESNYWYAQGNQTFAGDQALFVQYAVATRSDAELSTYLYEDIMRPELQSAVDWWIATDDADTPFDEADDNPYAIAEFVNAEDEAARSEQAFEEAKTADEVGDEFELASVLLALTLFFAGIATLFRRRPVSVALLGIGLVTLVAGAGQLALAAG